MPISRHHSGQWYYQFDRYINGQRVRANKLLPQGWTRSQADAYDRRESARLYDIATGGAKPEPMIEDAVLLYLQQHGPGLKNSKDILGALDLLHPHYAGRPFSDLPAIALEFAASAQRDGLAPGTPRGGAPSIPLAHVPDVALQAYKLRFQSVSFPRQVCKRLRTMSE